MSSRVITPYVFEALLLQDGEFVSVYLRKEHRFVGDFVPVDIIATLDCVRLNGRYDV